MGGTRTSLTPEAGRCPRNDIDPRIDPAPAAAWLCLRQGQHVRGACAKGWGSAAGPAAGDAPAPGGNASSLAAHIHGPSPQPTHFASADPADRRIFCPAPDGPLTRTYTASSTAMLLALEQLASAYTRPGLTGRPEASAGHPKGPNQALACQALSQPAPGASLGPSPC